VVLLLAWMGAGALSLLTLKHVDVLWVVGMRRRLWKPLTWAGLLTAAMAGYAVGTIALLWTLYALAVQGTHAVMPAWVWAVGVTAGGVVAGAIIATARLNMKTWVRMESRGA